MIKDSQSRLSNLYMNVGDIYRVDNRIEVWIGAGNAPDAEKNEGKRIALYKTLKRLVELADGDACEICLQSADECTPGISDSIGWAMALYPLFREYRKYLPIGKMIVYTNCAMENIRGRKWANSRYTKEARMFISSVDELHIGRANRYETGPECVVDYNKLEMLMERKQVDVLAEAVVEKLKKKEWTISFAESCTGGLAAAKLVDVPAASSVFNASVVTYANEAKIDYLGVLAETIEQYGVVSEAVAGQMAEGVANRNKAQVGVGISGVAGPTGGSIEKPIGMVCFGFFIDGKVQSYTKYFGDIGRNEVRKKSVEFVYETLNEMI